MACGNRGICDTLAGMSQSSRTRPIALLGRSLLATLALSVAALFAACAGGRGTPTATSTSARPQPTKVIATAGDTGLCSVISPADFAHVAGDPATQVTPGVTSDALTGLQEVYCLYLDSSDAQRVVASGTINYELAGDPQTATQIFQRVKQSFTSVTAVRGVGDAAFAGTPGGAGSGTGLVVVQRTLLLYVSVGGNPSTVPRIDEQLAALVLARVAPPGS